VHSVLSTAFSQALTMTHASLTRMRHLLTPSWSSLLAMTWYVLLSRLHCFLLLFPSQSLNIVESPRLRRIFRMLRADLRDTDIPGRTTLRSRVTELFNEHLEQLETEMKVSTYPFIVLTVAHSLLEISWQDIIHHGHVV
jgi:hypothetical protein